jgi:hypothetical protein
VSRAQYSDHRVFISGIGFSQLTRGGTSLPGTFSPDFVAGQKRYRILPSEKSIFPLFPIDTPAR